MFCPLCEEVHYPCHNLSAIAHAHALTCTKNTFDIPNFMGALFPGDFPGGRVVGVKLVSDHLKAKCFDKFVRSVPSLVPHYPPFGGVQ